MFFDNNTWPHRLRITSASSTVLPLVPILGTGAKYPFLASCYCVMHPGSTSRTAGAAGIGCTDQLFTYKLVPSDKELVINRGALPVAKILSL